MNTPTVSKDKINDRIKKDKEDEKRVQKITGDKPEENEKEYRKRQLDRMKDW